MKLTRKILAAKILAAKTHVLTIGMLWSYVSPSWSGIPVVDSLNLPHNILSAMEAVTQTAQQIQQYKTQLQQYENQLKNTMAPASYIWDQAQSTINELNQATNTLAYYQNQLGSLDDYLSKFQDVSYYRNSPCFSAQGCSDTEWAAMNENRRISSESQVSASKAVIKGISQQFKALQSDAKQLEKLQRQAQEAEGQLEAIQYANQFASQQSSQLLQIRSLMTVQYNAVTTHIQAETDQKARHQAAHEALFDFSSSTDRSKNRRF
ncbi:P-type conjugative transfer protein TrbJ [Vibrio natriegens]|uniref:P-type conjugative transfer protein TrbJ n=1 Tax=Vibrio diabolicus TaxID=50719 RepID=UPI0022B272EF|nr:P-type conjugative transfer protein TrbJ [Vibrio diabolicus]